MPAQTYDRNDLIAMLRYQFEIGIDEALLDFPDVPSSPVELSEFSASINTTSSLAVKIPGHDKLNRGL